MDKQQLINKLMLEPHVEGGYFSKTYQSNLQVIHNTNRNALSSIYYMLTDDSPIGYLHKNKSDIIHYFHAGSSLKYMLLYPDGRLEKKILGNDLQNGEQLQLVVTGGCWKATELMEGSYGLIREAVSPGFEYSHMQIADEETIKKDHKKHFEEIKKYIKM